MPSRVGIVGEMLAMVSLATALGVSAGETVLVEAESFERLGGWTLDAQFLDQMGSPVLLAHGLGVPVADATTTVRFPAAGRYRVFVRTRDWVPPHGPGRFQVRVAGRLLAAELGTTGDGAWVWQDGGEVDLSGGEAAVALHDLTGFEGRCDAILFVKDAPVGFRPPDEPKVLAAFRKRACGLPAKPRDAGGYDLVVVGGGFAGICASVAAARLGLKVALVQNRPVLGGCASSEIRVNPIGKLGVGPFPPNADIVRELRAGERPMTVLDDFRPVDRKRLAVVQAERNIALHLNTHAFAVEMQGERIAAAVARNTRSGEELRFAAPLLADCTGDGTLGYLAGADYRLGREGRGETGESLAPMRADKMRLGTTNKWFATDTGKPAPFPECPWALRVTEESARIPPPKWPEKFPPGTQPGMITAGGWNWESGFGRDPFREAEQIRDHNLRAIYGLWDFLKNRSPDRAKYATWRLQWAAYVAGVRETRRLLGDHVLTQQDIEGHRVYPDACVTATWYFDLHFPHPDNARRFPGREFRSIAFDDPNFAKYRDTLGGRMVKIRPYPIPWRCFYSRNVPNLMMAGRNISATHVGLAPVRVMNTTAMMGTVVGRAAYLCRTLGCDPRALAGPHLDAFKRLLRDPTRR